MKKLYLIAIALTLALSAAAQEKRHIFGVRVGMNFASMTMEAYGETNTPDKRGTYNIGASYQWALPRSCLFTSKRGFI